jgi:hypothetical protein
VVRGCLKRASPNGGASAEGASIDRETAKTLMCSDGELLAGVGTEQTCGAKG